MAVFDEEGPTPKFCYPEDLDFAWQLQIAMKTISLLMGERVYQDGEKFEEVRYFGILPFADFQLCALTYFFLISDAEARGQAKAATLTVLVEEGARNFFYENIEELQKRLDQAASQIMNNLPTERVRQVLEEMIDGLVDFAEGASPPSAERRLKVLFTGLDGAGKSSFLLAIKKRYSELLDVKPTKGLKRSETHLFNTKIVEWDLAGQSRYREVFLKQSEKYLYDVDVVFFVVDAGDSDRFEEAADYFHRVLNSLRVFEQRPPIVVCFHKSDPDLVAEEGVGKEVDGGEGLENLGGKREALVRAFSAGADDFHLKFFPTTVFDTWSLVSAFSYGLSRLSPNREIFRVQLEGLAQHLKARAILLLNENALVISDWAEDEISGKVFEASAPHFQSLYRTFKKFKLMKKDSADWKMEEGVIHFERLLIDGHHLYLMAFLPEFSSWDGDLDATLTDFVERISGLVDTYL